MEFKRVSARFVGGEDRISNIRNVQRDTEAPDAFWHADCAPASRRCVRGDSTSSSRNAVH
jgi:hypothetical protein